MYNILDALLVIKIAQTFKVTTEVTGDQILLTYFGIMPIYC